MSNKSTVIIINHKGRYNYYFFKYEYDIDINKNSSIHSAYYSFDFHCAYDVSDD